MEKQKKAIRLAARIIGGITFFAVFMLNIMLFVQSGGKGLSLETLKAYAQTGGTNNEEEASLFESRVKVEVTVTDTCRTGKGDLGTFDSITTSYSCVGSGKTQCTPSDPVTVTTDCVKSQN